MKYLIIFLLIIIANESITAQNFSKYINKSSSYLMKSLGNPELTKRNGDGFILQYSGQENGEKLTYGIKNGIVHMAIQSFPGLSLKEAINKKDVMILLYMSQGYIKQGTQAGMTVMKKNNKMLTVGYMDDNQGNYVTLITAYN